MSAAAIDLYLGDCDECGWHQQYFNPSTRDDAVEAHDEDFHDPNDRADLV